MQGKKTGGRVAGTPNKATADVKGFLERVFTRAFADPLFEENLVRQLVSLNVDSMTLKTLLGYYAGLPTKQVDHTHSGKVTLEQIVAGTVPPDEGGDDE